MWIIIFILSCLPKLEKLVPKRNTLSEVWHCFFQWKRRITQLKRSLIHPGFPLFSQKFGVNMASLMWLLLPAIVFPWIPVQGRTETQPACCFPPYTIILARHWPCWPPDCPSSSLKEDPVGRFQGGEHAGTAWAPLWLQPLLWKIPAPAKLHCRKPWVLLAPVTLSCPEGALPTIPAFQTAMLPFNCRPLPGAIPSWQLIFFL